MSIWIVEADVRAVSVIRPMQSGVDVCGRRRFRKHLTGRRVSERSWDQNQCRSSNAVLKNDGESTRVRRSGLPLPSSVPRLQHGHLLMSESAPRPHFAGESSSPDSELETSVRSSLQKTGYHQLRRLDVVVEDGQVKLSGRLPQFYLLQLAQQAVMKTAGVLNVDNGIEIVRA